MNELHNELAAESGTLSSEYQAAIALHRTILADGKIAADSMVALARDLKKMRDTKLYKQLGHETFEEYCEERACIRQRHAYNFIKIIEVYGEESLQENAALGITKLVELAKLDESDRQTIMENEDVASLSTRELQAKIDELQHKYDQLTFELSEKDKQAAFAAESAECRIKSLQARLDDTGNAMRATAKELKDAREQLKNPPPVEMSEAEKEKIRKEIEKEEKKRYTKEVDELKAALKSSEQKYDVLFKQNNELNAYSKKNSEKLDELSKALTAAERENENLQALAKKAQSAPPASEKKELLKYHFDEVQTAFNAAVAIIAAMGTSEKDAYKTAMLKLTDACRTAIEEA